LKQLFLLTAEHRGITVYYTKSNRLSSLCRNWVHPIPSPASECVAPLDLKRGVGEQPLMRIRGVYSGSRIRIFSSRILGLKDPVSLIRIRFVEFKYFLPKKLFLSSRKYDPGCLSRIQKSGFFHHPRSRILIPAPRVKKASDPNPQHKAGTQFRRLDRKPGTLCTLSAAE
jgi:hypothetical protein